jgi:ubiquitin-protein ligase
MKQWTPRVRRLHADEEAMRCLACRSELISFATEGTPADFYRVTYRCIGLVWDEQASTPVRHDNFEVTIVLHADYPRLQPQLRMTSPIFHPNIKNGGICINNKIWSPLEALDDLCVRIGHMIQYQNYDPYDFLDEKAAVWARSHAAEFPVDIRCLTSAQLQSSPGQPASARQGGSVV